MIPWAKFEGKETIYTDWVYNITPSILRHNVDPLSTIKKYAETHMMYNTTERRYAVSQNDHPANYDFEGQHVAELTTCLRNLTNYIEKHEPLFPSPIQRPTDAFMEDDLLGMGSLTTLRTLDDLPKFTLGASLSPTLPTQRPRMFSPTAIPISSILNSATSTPTSHPSTIRAQPGLIEVSNPWDRTSTDGSDEFDPAVLKSARAKRRSGQSKTANNCPREFRYARMRRGSKSRSGTRGSPLLGGHGRDSKKGKEQMLEERSEIAGVETRFAWEKREVQIDVEEFKMNGRGDPLAAIHTLSQALNGNGKRSLEGREGSDEDSQTRWMKQMKREVVSAREEGFKRQQEAMRDRGPGFGMSMPLTTGGEQSHGSGRGRGEEDQRVMWPQR